VNAHAGSRRQLSCCEFQERVGHASDGDDDGQIRGRICSVQRSAGGVGVVAEASFSDPSGMFSVNASISGRPRSAPT